MLCNFKVEKPSKTLKLKERILLTLKLKECVVFLFLWAPTLIFPKSICFWMVYICSVLSIRLAPSLQAVTSCRNGNHNSDITAQLHTLPRVNVPPPAVFVSAPWWVNTKVLRVEGESPLGCHVCLLRETSVKCGWVQRHSSLHFVAGWRTDRELTAANERGNVQKVIVTALKLLLG